MSPPSKKLQQAGHGEAILGAHGSIKGIKPTRVSPRLPKRLTLASYDHSERWRSDPIILQPEDYDNSAISKCSGPQCALSSDNQVFNDF